MAKDASQSNYSQDWRYTIPRTFMTPWVRNLISNHFLELSIAPVNPHTHHGVTYLGKQQIKDLKNKIKMKDKMKKFYYLCTGFSLVV